MTEKPDKNISLKYDQLFSTYDSNQHEKKSQIPLKIF